MTWNVINPFTAKINGKTKTFYPGDTIELSKDNATILLLGGVINSTGLTEMEHEYLILLARFWEIDTDMTVPMDESRRLVDRLDELYRTLQQTGHRIPVRLPLERNHDQAQRGLVL